MRRTPHSSPSSADWRTTLVASLLITTTSASSFDAHHKAFRRGQRHVLSGTIPSYSNSTTLFPTTVNATNNAGRYGHAAVLLASSHQLLFIGGQLGDNGTTITSEVLAYDYTSAFLWGARPTSIIPDNPAPVPYLSTGLPPHAWSASALDASNRTWLLGGVTANCEVDGIAYVLGGEGWTVPVVTPRLPPRRRQSSAVAVANVTTGGDDLWVFGGIAETYTCSEETIGYIGIDRWDTVGNTVETMKWDTPAKGTKMFQAPVGDYTATLLGDGRRIVVVGGQTSTGTLVDMGTVLVFDTLLRNWTSASATGVPPVPRMGHVAVSLPSGGIVIHGGLGNDHAPTSDVHLLTPPANSTSEWTWTTLPMSDDSITSPPRAWHTATMLSDGTIVVAFGIDSDTGIPSSDINFLTVANDPGVYTWKDTFDGVVADRPRIVANIKAVLNPKLVTTVVVQTTITIPAAPSPVVVAPSEPQSDTIVVANALPTLVIQPSNAPLISLIPLLPTLSNPASISHSTASSSSLDPTPSTSLVSPATIARDLAASQAAAEKRQTSIAASLGTIIPVLFLVLLIWFFSRRYFRKSHQEIKSPASFTAPFVSTLLYTRKVPSRMLSLGSTVSDHSQESDMRELDLGGRMAQLDPFADGYMVDEMGERSHIDPSTPGGRETIAPTMDSELSVTSLPYLHTIHRTASPDPSLDDMRSPFEDHYDPNLVSIVEPVLTTTPDLSSSSTFVDFQRSRAEPWDAFLHQGRDSIMGGSTPFLRSQTRSTNGGIPDSLRPSTPGSGLRVVNAGEASP